MEGIVFGIAIALLPISILVFLIATFTSKGKRGEKRVFKELKRLSDEYTIHNDVVLVTEK